MDNQTTNVINAYLKPKDISFQLIEPHNYHLNALERTIQTFKNRFIGALGMTNANFPIQHWYKLTLQVQGLINLLRQSQINPNMSGNKALKGPYKWNQYPMAPPGTKEIIYKDFDTRASWGPCWLH
jgi:hypothetical protein